MAMSPPAIRQALVQGQQAAEKALKAFLIGNGQLYPLTHDLERLRELCVAIDATLDAVARPCLDLTQFASLMRYPGCPDLPELELAWPWLHAAEALVAGVAERLGEAIQEPAAGKN
jgi:HEPN domain-containing protein